MKVLESNDDGDGDGDGDDDDDLNLLFTKSKEIKCRTKYTDLLVS